MQTKPDAARSPHAGRPALSILMYHQIGEFPAPKNHRAGYCQLRRFRAQMHFLKQAGYRVLPLDAALAGLFGAASLPSKGVVLTFDDGYRNFAEHALPVLQEHAFPATVFMISGKIGGRAEWLDAPDRPAPPLLSAAELRALRQAGIAIGSHTVSHPRLSRMPAGQVRHEINTSKQQLEDLLGEPVGHFCYPYGDYTPMVRDAVIEAGYQSALTCIRGAANTADNVFELPRKAISFGDNLLGYWWKLRMKNARKMRRGDC